MATTAQLAQYCADHFQLYDDKIEYIKYGLWALAAAIAYLIGRFGIPALWSDLKAIGSLFSGTKTSTTSASTTVTTTSASS